MAAFVVLDFLRLAFFMIPPVPRFVQLGSFLDSAKPPPKKQSPANVGPRPMMAQALGHCLGFEESLPSRRTRPVTTLVHGSRKPPLKLRDLIITHVVAMPLDFLVIIPLFQIQLVLPTVEGPQMRTNLDESASFDGMDRLAATQ
jgi:hypothetical protein